MPIKHKKEIADNLRSIFYASSKDKAKAFYKELKGKYEKDINGMRLYRPLLNRFLIQ